MKSLTLIFILFATITTFPQKSNDITKSDGQIKVNKPTVYLDYVCQDKKKVVLRVNNNTDWAISVGADDLYY